MIFSKIALRNLETFKLIKINQSYIFTKHRVQDIVDRRVFSLIHLILDIHLRLNFPYKLNK